MTEHRTERGEVLSREEVERIAFVRLNGDLGRPPTNDARALLAHDAEQRARIEALERLVGEIVTEADLEGEWTEDDLAVRICIPKHELDRLRQALQDEPQGGDDG